ncbi:MAG: hypothetical protein RL211_53, partial [Pseudomonadota bacterium]
MTAISPSDFLARTFHTVVFAGGGNRCWWQAGAVERLCEQANWQAKRLIGVSAGAGIATAFATGRLQESLRAAVERFNNTPKNIVWRDLLKGKRPFVLPRIYPDWIESFLQAADLQKLQRGTLKVDVAITRPIPFLPVTLSTAVALALYSTEKFWLKTFHGRLPHWVGLRPEYHDLTDCPQLDDARSLLLASAAAVPITPTHKVNGRAALDGGFYDNVPLPQDRADDAGTLVLLTRHRADLPQAFHFQGRTYLQPSRVVDATNMD